MAELLFDFIGRETETKPSIVGRGILPLQGKVILGGAAKSNKSFVLLNMALSLTKGEHLFGAKYKNGTPVFPVSRPWRVLLIEKEIGEDGLRKRLRGMVTQEQTLGAPFFIRSKDHKFMFDSPEGLAAIEADIQQVKPDVLLLDPISKFHSYDENSSQEMGMFMRKGDYLVEKYKLSIVYVHHTGLAAFDPQNSRRGGARLRGSSAIFADVDSFVEISREGSAHEAEPVLQLSFELRQGEPIIPVFVKRRRNGLVEFLGERTPISTGAAG